MKKLEKHSMYDVKLPVSGEIYKDDNYYVPEISEFHVGFEYEVFEKGAPADPNIMYFIPPDEEDRYYKFTFPDPFYGYHLDRLFKQKEIRVRHLDKQDIESLGWKFEKEYFGDIHFTKGNWDLIFSPGASINIEIDDYTDKRDQKFRGKIKNKSELKRLLNQLEI